MTGQNSDTAWLVPAISSGACAAFNGVFAKLTTTTLTSSWAHSIATMFHLDPTNYYFELAVRGLFLGLNILFNGVMWGLFTRALTLSNSTVRVSIINTSANFVLTAILSALVFGEELRGLWWVGAAMLVAGSVVIGRREESVVEGAEEKNDGGKESQVGVEGKSTGIEDAGEMRRRPEKDIPKVRAKTKH